MTIRNLEIFVEVCRQMNMSKAAQTMMISQSSVSQAISSLEKEYEVLLFERLNHCLYLTEAGRQMFYLSTQVLKSIESLDYKMKDASFQNTLNIGVCTTIASCLIHPLLAKHRSLHNTSRIHVEMNNSKSLEKRLLAAKLDLAIVQRTKPSPYLEYIPILDDELTVICWNEHPLAGKEVYLEELENEYFICREKGSGTELLLEKAFISHNLSLKAGWVCNSIDSACQAVMHQAGIAAVSHYLVREKVENHELNFIKIKDFRFTRQFDLAYHKDKIHEPHFEDFINTFMMLGKDGMEELITKPCVPYP